MLTILALCSVEGSRNVIYISTQGKVFIRKPFILYRNNWILLRNIASNNKTEDTGLSAYSITYSSHSDAVQYKWH